MKDEDLQFIADGGDHNIDIWDATITSAVILADIALSLRKIVVQMERREK